MTAAANSNLGADEAVVAKLRRVQRGSLVLGVLCLALCLLGAIWSPTQFFRSYLLAYVFWIAMPLGCIALLMLHDLTGGVWGDGIRPLLTSASGTLAFMALLFVPLLFGLSRIYLWAQPGAASDALLEYKRFYLSEPFFLIRTLAYFTIWIALAHALNRERTKIERGEREEDHFDMLSGAGLVLYVLTVTFASIDWVMSVEPHWFSTIYGLLFVVVQVLAALSLVVVAAYVFVRLSPAGVQVPGLVLGDLGNLLLTFVMLWAYLAFSQFLIIWSGNLTDEIPWYASRANGGWAIVAVLLIVFHFAVPFLLLLSRDVKRQIEALAAVGTGLLLLTLLDCFWLLTPGFEPQAPRVHWMDAAAVVGLGGIWFGLFLSRFKDSPLAALRQLPAEGAASHGD